MNQNKKKLRNEPHTPDSIEINSSILYKIYGNQVDNRLFSKNSKVEKLSNSSIKKVPKKVKNHQLKKCLKKVKNYQIHQSKKCLKKVYTKCMTHEKNKGFLST